uniref:RBR-type E3 ubiquitin transferase n=1 Tax=Angiostrongylus cantonensis TaxID=6313 RepID=A0A0K0DFB5_ANGCA
MDELLVVVHNRADHSRRSLSIPFNLNDTVRSFEEKISQKITKILLRSLIAFVENPTNSVDSSDRKSAGAMPVRSTPEIGSFYVWCKQCSDIQRGKLRVYCDKCSSSAVLLSNEPSCWRDVTKSHQIEANCADCNSSSYALFQFKCVFCNQIGAVLSQVRGNWEQADCSICLDVYNKYLFDFGCHHLVCRQCFGECLFVALKESRFVFRPTIGFTITCPYPGCERCVADAHHFRVLGEEKYQAYQRMATEKLIALDNQGRIASVFCPYPDCNSSFFWESENDDGRTSCPDCLRLFCRKCPGCGANTEHNGGCTHMHCIVCKTDWCFICVAQWTEECQWNHWFA